MNMMKRPYFSHSVVAGVQLVSGKTGFVLSCSDPESDSPHHLLCGCFYGL